MSNVIYINPYVYAGGGAPAPNPPQNVTITSAAQNTGIGATGTAGTANAITAVALYIDGSSGAPATNVQTVATGGTIDFNGLISDLGGPAVDWLFIGFWATVTTSGGGTPANFAWQLSIDSTPNSNINAMVADVNRQGQGVLSGAPSGGKVNATDTFDGSGTPFLQMNFEAGFQAVDIILDGLGEPAMNGETVVLRFTCVASNSAGDSASATPVVVNMIM
tara:strand:- start:3202 stop:3861 length:660 start_codon:yes stop_codon:yes gene_type:complete